MISAMTDADAQRIAEQHVIDWLKASNYECTKDTEPSNSKNIIATAKQAKLLVRVAGGEDPKDLPAEERHTLVSRASSLGHQAWFAKVALDARGALIGKIRWTKLD
jgi:putative SOS response-associated peptidase YedK